MVILAVLLLSVALVVGLPVACFVTPGRGGLLRLLRYAIVTAVVVMGAFAAVLGGYEHTNAPCAGDCDLEGLAGIVLGYYAFVASLVVALIVELLVRRVRLRP